MKKLKLMLVMLACFVGSFAWQSVQAAKHTAYVIYADAGWTPNRAHVWEEDTPGKRTEWPGTEITVTDSGKKFGGKTVWTFEFDVTFTPKNIIFGKDDKSEATDDCLYPGDNALFTISSERNTENSNRNKISAVANPVFDSEPTPAPAGNLYLYGNINGTNTWDTPAGGHDLGEPDGTTYIYKMSFSEVTNWFKFYDDKNKSHFKAESNDQAVVLNKEYTAKTTNPTNNAYMLSVGGTHGFANGVEYYLVVNYSGTGSELTFKFTDNLPTPEYPSTINIRGWKSGESSLKTYPSSQRDAEGKYRFTLDFDKDINWFFETSDARYVPVGASNLKLDSDGTYSSQKKAVTYTSTQFSSKSGEYDVTAWFEDDVIKFTYSKKAVAETYEDLYIVGAFTEMWEFRERFKASSTDGVYEWKLSSFPYAGKEWKISGDKFSVEYSAGTIMPEGNAPARTIDFNTSYTCNSKKSGESKGLGNMIMSADANKAVTVKLDLTVTPPVLSLVTEGAVVHPDKYLTIYMSFGQDRIARPGCGTPRIHFFNARQTAGMNADALAALNDPEMTKVYPHEPESPLWKYTITEDQLKSVKDVMFYFHEDGFASNHSKHQQYIAGLAENWDTENWTKYIYFADNGNAAQSYMTFEQYEKVRDEDKGKLYILGNGFDGLNGWTPMPSASGGTLVVTANEGVFYTELHKGSKLESSEYEGTNQGAKFKMSWIRPYEWWLKSGKSGGEQDEQRSWATFNLGIVGYNLSLVNSFEGKLPVITTGSELNGEIYCTPTRILPVNNYNQYDWFIRERYLDGTTTYTLVVDLNPECNTVCLLPCSPHPTVKAESVSSDKVTLEDPAAAMKIWDNSTTRLMAEGVNGKAVFTEFNVLTAEAEIKAATHNTIKSLTDPVSGDALNYEINYEIYSGDQLVGTYSGEPGHVTISGVSIGDKAALGVRARYASPVTGLQFHSEFSSAVIDVTGSAVILQPLAVGEVTEKTFTHGTNNLDDETSPFYTLGAYGLVPVTAPEGDYAWYADFRLTTDGHHIEHPQHANGGEVVGTGHHATKLEGVKVDSIAYSPWADGDFDTAVHDWSGKLSKLTEWPLHLPEVVRIDRTYNEDGKGYTETEATAEVKIEAYAVYPFLVNPNAQVVVSAANRNSVRRKAVSLDPDANYVLKLEHAPVANGTFSLGSGDLTAVKDIIAAPAVADGPVEYYNLQGVRMHGDLAPGLYIRRQGTETAKVVIR